MKWGALLKRGQELAKALYTLKDLKVQAMVEDVTLAEGR